MSLPDVYFKMHPWNKCFETSSTKTLERMWSIEHTHALTSGGEISERNALGDT